jgi:phosphoribosylformylglycinamidine synthase
MLLGMICFFENNSVFALQCQGDLNADDIKKLEWLFNGASFSKSSELDGRFIGPRREMITPWSTNAVEITQNMGIQGIMRIEEFFPLTEEYTSHDRMLQLLYEKLDQEIFTIHHEAESVRYITDISSYNFEKGLSLSEEEIRYLYSVAYKIGRSLTDSEVFGFSQMNSEHCRHKIFNGQFIIDGREMEESLFAMIRKTSRLAPGRLVSAYKDNVAFISGPSIEQFAPAAQDKPDYFVVKDIQSVLSLKAETHNFPTTVEPFNGAATGSGGEIRDRMAGGRGSMPLAGTAVYMTSYTHSAKDRPWENSVPPRQWLYQTPEEILIKASNGASDFGNKFGQPLICGSLLTFEHAENGKVYGYDKVIMQAGGVGYAKQTDSLKDLPVAGDKIVVLGGDNYRIGMGGGAVSSVATGEYDNNIELNAVQRSNPEMQKRVYNAIRAMAEMDENPVISIHDHGAGGHLNSLSELVEATGGRIKIDKLPVGDPTLSARELIGNESQERMGLIIRQEDIGLLKRVSSRERAPMYEVGETTGDMHLTFENSLTGEKPIDLGLEELFGTPPRTVLNDETVISTFEEINYKQTLFTQYLEQVLSLEAVGCKDWLTNKVDRSVTGRIAMQQCAGPLQLPLNNLGVVALDFQGKKGIATSLGHAPVSALIDPARSTVLSIAEALTNLVWAPISGGLGEVSLSANWMWPAKNQGEDARLYTAVKAASDFAIALGLNIPTGKDSLSMTQKYPDGSVVFAPGTLIITAVGEVTDIRKVISPVLAPEYTSTLIFVDFSGEPRCLGGSSLGQVLNGIGHQAPSVANAAEFRAAFEAIQQLIEMDIILAGHDVSAGGMITTILEMAFAQPGIGLQIDTTEMEISDSVRLLFSENPGVIIQVNDLDFTTVFLHEKNIRFHTIGKLCFGRKLHLKNGSDVYDLDIDALRDIWFNPSYQLDRRQCGNEMALQRFTNYKSIPLEFNFGESFNGKFSDFGIDPYRRASTGIKAAIIREKGVNGDREMAWSLYLAGFDVKDVHMTDLIAGRETLEDISMIVFVGGFSNSDVLGSARGWAGAFRYNEKARESLEAFYSREDTLSLGVCNGCQLMIELGLITPEHLNKPHMKHNASHKFESAFLSVDILENDTVMLHSMAGQRLGIWVAHGEGRFILPYSEENYYIAAKYSSDSYPANPNGSDYSVACLATSDGRHLAIMPHLERSVYPWQWGYYPRGRSGDELSPWIEAFVNAREWVKLRDR